jgi:hypothetical protein
MTTNQANQVMKVRRTCAAFFFSGIWDMNSTQSGHFLDDLEIFAENDTRKQDTRANDWLKEKYPDILLHHPFEADFLLDIQGMYENLVSSIVINVLEVSV